ncbi:MAG: hypothetical protein ACREP9_14210 [Candidatus Dormibacteraceae bacterium]
MLAVTRTPITHPVQYGHAAAQFEEQYPARAVHQSIQPDEFSSKRLSISIAGSKAEERDIT